MASGDRCKECGTAIPADSPEGFCAQCLLGLGLEKTASLPEGRHSPALTAPLKEKPGDRIGRYKLLQEIGHGGCGVVYMAEQKEPIHRRVALKVIKLGMDTKQVVARFEAERQALALMDHPNIAKVLDAGATETGRPYFVMELVGGIRITDYCDQHQLTTRQRLDLFIQVCKAIQHAHQKGIIHRDIKPSNVLVTEQDGVAAPKVIDFGIAKATQGRLTDQTLFTAFEQFLGTPAYMSPEQTQLGSLDVDTRSDIYSLGVLLYELLTGKTPFDTKELMAAGLDEMRRTIREVEPVKPSTRLTQELQRLGSARAPRVESDAPSDSRSSNQHSREESQSHEVFVGATKTAREARALPEKTKELVHSLRGDLDWIVMKCLEKDRARRYETANGLATDIERHLNNEPVVARPPSKFYEFQKMVRRHKFGFAAVAAIAIVLVIGIAISTWQWARADKIAETQRRTLYVSEMSVAFQSFALGNVGHTRWLLENQRPKPGETDLRGFEWRYLWGLSRAQEVFPFPVEPSEFWSLAFSSNGQYLAAGTFAPDGAVYIWDFARKQEVARLRTLPGLVDSLSFTADDQKLACSYRMGRRVVVWDLATHKPTLELTNFSQDVFGAAFSPDGKHLGIVLGEAYGSAIAGEAMLVEASTGKLLMNFPNVRSWLARAVFSPDGRMFIATGGEGTVQIWETATGREMARLEGHRGVVFGLSISRDGRKLATGNSDGVIRIWEVEGFRSIATIPAHANTIGVLAFSPDGRLLASGSTDHTVKLWDIGSLQLLNTYRGHNARISGLDFSPDGEHLVSASNDGAVKVWDPTQRQSVPEFRGLNADRFFHIAFSPDGRLLAMTTNTPGNPPPPDHITTLDVATRAQRAILPGNSFAFFEDGGFLATRESANRILLIRTDTMETTARLQTTNEVGLWTVSSRDVGHRLAFSPDGHWLAAGCQDNRVQIWELATQRPFLSLSVGTNSHAPAILFTPDSKFLLTWEGGDQRVNLWKSDSWKPAGDLPCAAQRVALSPGGQTLATSALNVVSVWDLPSRRKLKDLNSDVGTIWSLAISADGRTLAAGSYEGQVKLWDLATLREITALPAHKTLILSVTFSRDGRYLATACFDGSVKLWEAPGLGSTELIEAKVPSQ